MSCRVRIVLLVVVLLLTSCNSQDRGLNSFAPSSGKMAQPGTSQPGVLPNVNTGFKFSGVADTTQISLEVFSGDILADSIRVASYQGPAGQALLYLPSFPGDMDNNGAVDFQDFLVFAENWLSTNTRLDFNRNGLVDFPDFLVLAKYFGRRASQVAGKIATLPDSSEIEEPLGNMAVSEVKQFVSILAPAARANKLAQFTGTRYLVKVQSLAPVFSSLDTVIIGYNPQFTERVLYPVLLIQPDKTGPTISLLGGEAVYIQSDDKSRFVRLKLESGEAVLFDSLMATPIDTSLALLSLNLGLGQHQLVATATDSSSNTSVAEPLNIAIEPIVLLGLTIEAPAMLDSLVIPNNYSGYLITVIIEVNNVVKKTWEIRQKIAGAPLESYFEDADNLTNFFIKLPYEGNRRLIRQEIILRGDKNPPRNDIDNVSWSGNNASIAALFQDSASDIAEVRLSAADANFTETRGGGGQNVGSTFNVSFPAAENGAKREIKLWSRDAVGNEGEAVIFIDQPKSETPPPPPPPPPPDNVAPTLSATVNGQTGTIQVSFGSALTFSAAATGTPTPTITWTFAGQTVQSGMAAKNGTLTVTATNLAGSASQSFNIVAILGAP